MRAALMTALVLLAGTGGASALESGKAERTAYIIQLRHALSGAMHRQPAAGCGNVRVQLDITRRGSVSNLKVLAEDGALAHQVETILGHLRLPPPPKTFPDLVELNVPFRFAC